MADKLPDDVRERAYQLWVQEGRPHGRDVAHWLQAEKEAAAETRGPDRGDGTDGASGKSE